ncbi:MULTISPECIES: hypothetical protein [unclassified Ensifer]|uniref:hypothetical protein n=1 Tax=unclassified Ensifer TaxID=2633371 RepID=UPI000812D720|nr:MULTISPECIES: hypothetical protein [unclassified Ensifer]OCP25061.1 hypothetical protein BC361_18485 [Ensifer sp. LC54]OCP25276.1 hypothetical protein BC363_20665 [Ensifer sp. LC384]
MFGATLSRWTMSYFAAALIFLAIGEMMMVFGFGYPGSSIEAPETLALVHTIALGWLSLLMAGALLQFVPVLVGRPLSLSHLAFPALVLLVVGITSLVLGFIGLAGADNLSPLLLPFGATVTIAGFGLLIIVFAATLWRARPLPLPARFVAVGLGTLVMTISLGGTYAFVLAGLADAPGAIDLTLEGVSLHAVLGLGGWLSFTTMGVSYRLLTMFMLSPDRERLSSRVVWVLGAAALVMVACVVPMILSGLAGKAAVLFIAALAGVIAIGIYMADIVRIYRERKRKHIELNSRAGIGAFSALTVATLFFLVLAAVGQIESGLGPLVYLVTFGWLTGMGLAQLYKIVPFITWLECYGPLLGRMPTPRVQDLVVEARAAHWFRLFYFTVIVASIALSFDKALLFRASSLGQLIAVNALLWEFAATRRLSNVPDNLRLSGGFAHPHLIFPPFQSRRQP